MAVIAVLLVIMSLAEEAVARGDEPRATMGNEERRRRGHEEDGHDSYWVCRCSRNASAWKNSEAHQKDRNMTNTPDGSGWHGFYQGDRNTTNPSSNSTWWRNDTEDQGHLGNSTNDENERLREKRKHCPCESGVGRWVCVGTDGERKQDDGDEDEDEDEQIEKDFGARSQHGAPRSKPGDERQKEVAGPRGWDGKKRRVGASCGKGSHTGGSGDSSHTGGHSDGSKRRKILFVALGTGGSCLSCILFAAGCMLCKRRATKPKSQKAGPGFGRTVKDEQIVVGTVFDLAEAKTDNANLDLEVGA